MTTIKLSELPSATNPTGSEILPVVQNGQTVGMTIRQTRKTADASVTNGNATDMFFYTGAGNGTGHGGNINFFAGDGGEYGWGGNFNFYGGASNKSCNRGGYFWVGCGNNYYNFGHGGYISLSAGAGSRGGDVYIRSGPSRNSEYEGVAGNVYIYAMYGYTTGGSVEIRGGDTNSESGYVYGGNISLSAGGGVFGGTVSIYGGNGNNGRPGPVLIKGGESNTTYHAGSVVINGGYSATGAGGNTYLRGGNSDSNFGGNLTIGAGNGIDPGLFYILNLPDVAPEGKAHAVWNNNGVLSIT